MAYHKLIATHLAHRYGDLADAVIKECPVDYGTSWIDWPDDKSYKKDNKV